PPPLPLPLLPRRPPLLRPRRPPPRRRRASPCLRVRGGRDAPRVRVSRVVLRGGPPVHPWVFSKRVLDVDRGVRDGDVVSLATREGRACGWGIWHSRSL